MSGEYGIGYTSNGELFYFDKEDFPIIAPYAWWVSQKGYICTTDNKKNIPQHRMIIDCPKDLQIDHINNCKYDNRKKKLRICNNQQNHRNKPPLKNNRSGKTGVCKYSKNGKWRAYITVNDKQISLGHYDSFDDAVNARIKAEKELFKDFRYIPNRGDNRAKLS